MVDTPLPSAASPSLHRLDQIGHRHLSPGGDVDRSCQKQVRTRGRKCPPPTATRYSSSTGETTTLYQNGPDAPGAAGWGGQGPGNKPCSLTRKTTLPRWHRQGFKLYWKYKSRATSAKPKISAETVALIKEMARNNRLWGAERIRGELLKLGLRVCLPHHPEVHETRARRRATRTEVEHLLTHSC
jgi:hypothetical protein